MSTEAPYGWMWLRALEFTHRLERSQSQLLRYLGPGVQAVSWEPPVDIQQTAAGLIVTLALPGVAPKDIEVSLERAMLTVSALRPLRTTGPDSVIRRLEIPHGRFLRRIALPESGMQIVETRLVHGCLELRLLRAAVRG